MPVAAEGPAHGCRQPEAVVAVKAHGYNPLVVRQHIECGGSTACQIPFFSLAAVKTVACRTQHGARLS